MSKRVENEVKASCKCLFYLSKFNELSGYCPEQWGPAVSFWRGNVCSVRMAKIENITAHDDEDLNKEHLSITGGNANL